MLGLASDNPASLTMPTTMLQRLGLPLVVGSFLAVAASPATADDTPAALQFFETKVRPLLAEHCYKCHADKKQRGSLRVDSRAALLQGGDQGPALVPGEPDKSLIVKAIRHDDKELKMPPSQKLAREHIATLTQWVQMGAPWPSADKTAVTPRKADFQISDKDRAHWAFQPVRRPALPKVKDQTWGALPIDAFILAGLEAKGLKPNPPASTQELVRRLYYDLTGLPPTPQELEAFLVDSSSGAYERLVDKLLDSPRYGEKWARYWLDLVHYAETNSYERDNPKPHVWRYRDYVIRSFNQDKPFDRFIKEQLAGDERFPADPDALIATGFYRLGIWDDEPSDPVQARYDMLDDIVATTGQVFLGLTFDCARCHNHKIDPIAQKDYYRLLAFFHNINHYRNGGPSDEAVIAAGPAAQQRAQEALKALEERRTSLQTQMTAIERDFLAKAERNDQAGGKDLAELHYRYYRGAWQKLPDFAALRPEVEGKLPKNLFDLSPRTRNDTFGFVFEGVLNVPTQGEYTFILDSDDGSRLSVDGKTLLEYDGIHGTGSEKIATLSLPPGKLPIKLEYFQNVFGLGLRVAWSGPGFTRRLLSAAVSESFAPTDLGNFIKTRGAEVLGVQRYQEYYHLKKDYEALKKELPVGVEKCLCVTEAGRTAPQTFVMLRGNPHVKGDQVEPGFPTVFNLPEPKMPAPSGDAKTTGRRSVLADWIAAPDNRMTTRVLANRIWQYHFGRGIVRTPNDFGLHGARPTHPELLDWLATELVQQGWHLKSLHRAILTSNAYRMSSRANPQALAADPANDQFWRFDMRRLSAEEIRDSILAVSGNLSLKMYGPGVYPEIPREVLEGQSVPGRGWVKSPPDEANRRSIYVHVKRSLLLPILESFDLAETDRTTPVRFATTQPTQALGMLNGDFLNQQAALLAQRLKREAGDEVQRQVRLGLYLATQRQPSASAIRHGVDLIQALQAKDGATPEAALNTFCLLALNLNEFMYLD
jgi:hypothetical protein